jgi:hypothetical protein
MPDKARYFLIVLLRIKNTPTLYKNTPTQSFYLSFLTFNQKNIHIR